MGKYQRHYNTLNLSELRHRQHLNAIQTTEAYRLIQRPYTYDRGYRALVRLQRVAKLLQAAVLKHIKE